MCGVRAGEFSNPQLHSNGESQARDGAMMLSHQRPYRELPLEWVEAMLRRKGLDVVRSKRFSSTLGIDYIRRQLKWAGDWISRGPFPGNLWHNLPVPTFCTYSHSLHASRLKHVGGCQGERQ